MTAKTWIAEFYPIKAEEITEHPSPKRPSGEDGLKALDHSILKWEGLHHDNLKRHGLDPADLWRTGTGPLWSEQGFSVGASSCALCYMVDEECSVCPFTLTIGRRCTSKQLLGVHSPWSFWSNAGNPDPMLTALLNARAIWISEHPELVERFNKEIPE
jgi:hypothetical protein